jgi:hypothetical protein
MLQVCDEASFRFTRDLFTYDYFSCFMSGMDSRPDPILLPRSSALDLLSSLDDAVSALTTTAFLVVALTLQVALERLTIAVFPQEGAHKQVHNDDRVALSTD